MNSNLADGEAIGSKWLSKAIETAQKKVEARNYDIRKQVVEYDDVMNDQRKVIYEQRAEIMDSETVDDVVVDMRHDAINAIVGEACPPGSYPEQWNIDGLKERVADVLGLEPPIDDWMQEDALEPETDRGTSARTLPTRRWKTRSRESDASIWRQVEKSVLLDRLDHYWKEHLATLDALRQVVFLRAYAQKQPINEYKQEAFGLFERMLETIREDVTRILLTSELRIRHRRNRGAARTARLPYRPYRSVHRGATTRRCAMARPGARRMFGSLAGCAVAAAGPGGARSDNPYAGHGHQPQCAVPLRFGQQIQALPRGDRLDRPRAVLPRL